MALVAQSDTDALLAALSTVTPAFGRGESIDVNGSTVELLLVKNPMGFRLSLASFPACRWRRSRPKSMTR